MKFAIIIPTYNRAWLLPRAIRSVLAQSYADWLLYIVDDASTDDTESVVSPYLVDPRVRYLRNTINRGMYYSWNVALQRVEVDGTDWVTKLDDDDQQVEGCLDAARKEIERWPGYGMFLFSTVDREGKSLSHMSVSGPVDYIREMLLRKTIAGEMDVFVSVPYLSAAPLYASIDLPSTGPTKFWFGELSLQTGAVCCDKVSQIREYRSDGVTMEHRRQGWRKRTRERLRVDWFIVHHWLGVIRRHPYSLASYQVWTRALARVIVRGLKLSFGSARNEPRSR